MTKNQTHTITVRFLPEHETIKNPDWHKIHVFSDGTCVWENAITHKHHSEIFEEVKFHLKKFEDDPDYEVRTEAITQVACDCCRQMVSTHRLVPFPVFIYHNLPSEERDKMEDSLGETYPSMIFMWVCSPDAEWFGNHRPSYRQPEGCCAILSWILLRNPHFRTAEA